jgi:hypothetical protein
MLREYDFANREIVRRILSADRKPVRAVDSGRSIIRTNYDHRNLKIRENSFDEFDQPVDRADEHWSTKEWQFDTNGQLVKIVYRDKAGHELWSSGSD